MHAKTQAGLLDFAVGGSGRVSGTSEAIPKQTALVKGFTQIAATRQSA
jgi:hypothetical protein